MCWSSTKRTSLSSHWNETRSRSNIVVCNLLERSMYMFWWNIVESSVKHLNPNPINSDVSISKFYFNNGIIIFFWQDKPQQNENITAVVNKLFDEGHLIAETQLKCLSVIVDVGIQWVTYGFWCYTRQISMFPYNSG
jgi:hypothetical protein